MDEDENSVAVRVTNAPEPCDGFGTRTIEVLLLDRTGPTTKPTRGWIGGVG
jgi:hypothetical protein